MSLKNIDLTTALRPSLLPDEVLLAVQGNVGLYEGKFKIPEYQNGQAYLTSHRICYVGHEDERKHSVGIDLRDVERYEFYAGFLKSSPKITLIPKPPPKRSSAHFRSVSALNTPSRSATASPAHFHLPPTNPVPAKDATWVCPICTFSNPVPSNFDPLTANEYTPLAPCLACGIKPPLALILKAAISSAANRPVPTSVNLRAPVPIRGGTLDPHSPDSLSVSSGDLSRSKSVGNHLKRSQETSIKCPRCTFLNHASLVSCELCGASLAPTNPVSALQAESARAESPGPMLPGFQPNVQISENVKLSFRGGGEKIFNERLQGALTQRKWLLQNARPVPKPGQFGSPDELPPPRVKTAGIAGLEQRRLDTRKNNEVVIGNAFEDLEALMISAKEIIALAESFARQTNTSLNGTSEENALLAQSASALGLVTTKDMLSGGGASETLYLSELARNLAEFLTDDARGILRKAGGIMTLVDLWAIFNRARGGVELVSPNDFEKAARLWEKLRLPVRLRKFKSGVLVVQSADRTDEKTIQALLSWLDDLHNFPPEKETPCDWRVFGRGITIRDAAERFGWSIGVATEELEMAEESGAICREEGIEGLKYWENWIGCMSSLPSKADQEAEQVAKQLEAVLAIG